MELPVQLIHTFSYSLGFSFFQLHQPQFSLDFLLKYTEEFIIDRLCLAG